MVWRIRFVISRLPLSAFQIPEMIRKKQFLGLAKQRGFMFPEEFFSIFFVGKFYKSKKGI